MKKITSCTRITTKTKKRPTVSTIKYQQQSCNMPYSNTSSYPCFSPRAKLHYNQVKMVTNWMATLVALLAATAEASNLSEVKSGVVVPPVDVVSKLDAVNPSNETVFCLCSPGLGVFAEMELTPEKATGAP